MLTFRDAINQNRTLVFGHRGAKAYAPMNTIPAFEMAAKQRADGIELDVHRTKDGEVVIVHDFTVDATTNGSGRVVDLTLAELKALDAGSWFSEAFSGVKIPTLDETFEAVGQQVFVNVEIKSNDVFSDGVEQAVANVISNHNMQSRVIVSSFNPLAVRRFAKIMPDVPLAYLSAPETPDYFRLVLKNVTYHAEHPYHEMIDSGYVEQCRQDGYWLNTWTVNHSQRAKELRDMGVNTIITDNPDLIVNALAE